MRKKHGLRLAGLPAILLCVAAAAAVVFWPIAASGKNLAVQSASTATATFTPANHVNSTFTGCRNDGSIILPIAGKFICPDAAYTSGNLGKGWNELDLVPFRLLTDLGTQADASTDYNLNIAADYEQGGHLGYDVISEPVVNTAKSDASCSVSAGAQQTVTGVTGGTDVTAYRVLTIHQAKGTICVFDWVNRIALGAHLFSGSNLQAYIFDSVGLSGGKSTIPIPVNQIAPQSLSKDMSATQGADHIWEITKKATPTSVSFGNTCDTKNHPTSAAVSVDVTWTKDAADPSGPITVVTHVYAINPAARTITTNVTDVIYSGTTQLDSASTPVGGTDVPPNTTLLVITHQTTVPSGTTDLNDIATGSYTDAVTGVAIPGTTTATASATVQPSGVEKNPSATITDSESITSAVGALTFSADSATNGSFDSPYVLGTPTVGPVGWTSASQTGSGSVTLKKTVYVDAGVNTTGSLDDTATVAGIDGFSASANASVALEAHPLVSLTITKTISASATTDQTFKFDVSGPNSSTGNVITIKAGDTSNTITLTDLEAGKYTVHEQTPPAPWVAPSDQSTTINASDCSGGVTMANTFAPATAQVAKATIPGGSEAGWKFTLTGSDGSSNIATTTGTGYVGFNTATLVDGVTYTMTETGQTGWDLTGVTGDRVTPVAGAVTTTATSCSFTVHYVADAGAIFECKFTNTQEGSITVKKLTYPSSATDKFTFTGDLAGSIGNGEQIGPKSVVPGTYSTTETVLSGWDLTKIVCSDSDSAGVITTGIATFKVAAGENVTCTYTNTQRGTITVKKVTAPTTATDKFAFTGALVGSIGNGEQIGPKSVVPGTYSTTETVLSGWDLTKIVCSDSDSAGVITTGIATFKVAAGEDVTCTYTNTQRGKAKVVKTVNGLAPSGAQTFTFQLRQGASSTVIGTTLESADATAANGGVINFTTKLVPGSSYQLCEVISPAWSTTLGTFVPGSFNPPDGTVPNPNVDNSILCVNFTVAAGETKTFTVDNTPPPGGRALTIGYWKNWASCAGSSGNKKAVLDQTLALAEPAGVVISAQTGTYSAFGPTYYLVLHGSATKPNIAPDCQKAVNLLNKSTVTKGTKMASDPIFNMTAQLVAAEVNYAAGAGKNGSTTTNITSAVLLNGKYKFNGDSYTPKLSSADSTKANCLATQLDNYNNDRAVSTCP